VRSVKEEFLSKVILFGERSLRRALSEYVDHFHAGAESPGEGQHPAVSSGYEPPLPGRVRCRERLGGLLRYYHREAA